MGNGECGRFGVSVFIYLRSAYERRPRAHGRGLLARIFKSEDGVYVSVSRSSVDVSVSSTGLFYWIMKLILHFSFHPNSTMRLQAVNVASGDL